MKNKALLVAALFIATGLAACGTTPSNSSSAPASSSVSSSASATEEKIVLTASASTVYVGETVTVTSSVAGVTFESRDATVASVDQNGVVTGLKAGSTTITARKSGYKAGTVNITVEKAPQQEAQGILEFEDAEHYDPDGFWGMEFWGQVYGPGETPVEETETASGGKSVGWFNQGCKETIKFTSSKAGTVNMGFMMAYNAETSLDGLITIKVNGVSLDMAGKSVAGPSDGDTNNYYDWNEVMFLGVTLQQGDNEIVVECVGANGVNMDCVRLYGEGFTFVQTKVVPLGKITVSSGPISIFPEETSQIVVDVEGVSYVSDKTDIATVSSTGLVTAVAPGTATITISKDGYKDATVSVTVKTPAAAEAKEYVLEYEDADHYSPNGKWGDSWGEGRDTPVEDAESASGGKSLGSFKGGCVETLDFTVSKAASVTLDFYMAYSSSFALQGKITIKVNGVALDLTDKNCPAPKTQGSYYDFDAVSFEGVALKEGRNSIVIEFLANSWQYPNLDCLKVTADEEINLQKVAALPALELSQTSAEVVVGSTVQLSVGVEGVTYASEDASIATVSASGLVTGVARGSTNIIVSKEGYKDAKVAITVKNATPVYQGFVLEFEDAVHYSPNDKWGDSWGAGTDSPVESNEFSSGGKSVGNFKQGCKETLTFNSSASGAVTIKIYAASSLASYDNWPNITMSDMAIADYMTLSLNESAVSLAGKTLPGVAEQNYYNFQPVELSINVQEGLNTLVFEITGQQGPNMDCVVIPETAGFTFAK